MSHMTTITKGTTVEELRAAAAELQARLAAVEKAEKAKVAEQERLDRLASAIAANTLVASKFNLYAEQLAKALVAAGLGGGYEKAFVKTDSGELVFPRFGLAYPFAPRFEARHSGTSWRQNRIGYHVAVGASGDGIKIFPPLAKGGYSYDKVAAAVAALIKNSERERESRAIADRLDKEAQDVAAKLGGHGSSWEYAGGGRSRRGAPKVVLSLTQAKALLERLEKAEAK